MTKPNKDITDDLGLHPHLEAFIDLIPAWGIGISIYAAMSAHAGADTYVSGSGTSTLTPSEFIADKVRKGFMVKGLDGYEFTPEGKADLAKTSQFVKDNLTANPTGDLKKFINKLTGNSSPETINKILTEAADEVIPDASLRAASVNLGSGGLVDDLIPSNGSIKLNVNNLISKAAQRLTPIAKPLGIVGSVFGAYSEAKGLVESLQRREGYAAIPGHISDLMNGPRNQYQNDGMIGPNLTTTGEQYGPPVPQYTEEQLAPQLPALKPNFSGGKVTLSPEVLALEEEVNPSPRQQPYYPPSPEYSASEVDRSDPLSIAQSDARNAEYISRRNSLSANATQEEMDEVRDYGLEQHKINFPELYAAERGNY